ncbi:MAG: FkbM family methyltransferase [Flavobacteriales bacterium]|nr:FkbM family methyltransferase [Flavobacteriales bacterium]
MRNVIKRIANTILGERLAFRIARSLRPRDPEEAVADERRKVMYAQLVSPGDLCFDVGANIGNRVAPLLAVGARVVAVEPQPECYRVLDLRFGKRIELVRKGLAAEPGTMQMYLSKEHVLSSFSKEWIDTVQQGRFSHTRWDRTITVEMTTLDALIRTYGRPRFIKIDVEGFESTVLSGLSRSVPYISFEYTLPEQRDKAIACIDLIHRSDAGTRFNHSKGETMEWAWTEWLDHAAMRAWLQSDAPDVKGFGDIYARSSDA